MATAAQQQAYKALLPHANTAAAKLGVPAYGPLIWAWWAWETAFGTNNSSKANNHAGILKSSGGDDYDAGQYAGYHSIGNFVNDYVRVLSLKGRGYEAVIAAMKSGKSFAEVTQLHNASKWSEADYNVNTIVKYAAMVGGTSPVGGGSPALPDVSGLSPDQLKLYAGIGLAVVGIVVIVR